MRPTRLRKEAGSQEAEVDFGTSTVQLTYIPPYDWDDTLTFLRNRAIKQVEYVTEENYSRTVNLGKHCGWVRVSNAPAKHSLKVEFTRSLTPVLPALLGRLRNLFDLSARPDVIAAHLAKDPLLRRSVAANPGLRVPGAFDGFEMAIRAVLGQQITVKAATTIGGRFAEAFGEKFETPFSELTRLAPLVQNVAGASIESIAKLGIVSARAASIIALANEYDSGKLRLDPGADPDVATTELVAIRGIGPWTAQYIAMRALRWPDAFPKEDIAVRNNLGGVTAKQAEEMSQRWRPWRSYAVRYIWQGLSGK